MQKVQSADTFYIIKNMACIERVQTSAHACLHLVQMGYDATITNTLTSCLRDFSACLSLGLASAFTIVSSSIPQLSRLQYMYHSSDASRVLCCEACGKHQNRRISVMLCLWIYATCRLTALWCVLFCSTIKSLTWLYYFVWFELQMLVCYLLVQYADLIVGLMVNQLP